MEQITQIAGMKTTSTEKDKFIKIVNDLMETIEEVCNGDKNTEGNYLTLMNDLKKLYNMKEKMNGNVVYQSFRRPPPQPRQTHLNLQQKLQDPKYFKCEKCETTTLKKNRQRHYESDLCKITYQTKCSAVVVDSKQHKWYGIQQVLTSCFRTRQEPLMPFSWDIIRSLTPDKTCVVCDEKQWGIYESKGYYALTEYSCGKIKKEFVPRHNLEGECNDCCFNRLEEEKRRVQLAKEEKRIKNREVKLAREAKKLAKEQAKEVSENLLMGENDINQNVKKPKPVLIIEEEEELPTPVLLRKIWIENYNKSLPQNKFYNSEFECEMSIAIGGIYDSEAMNFEWDNIQSNRIKQLLKIVPVELPEEEELLIPIPTEAINYYTNKLEKYAKKIKCPEEIVNMGIYCDFEWEFPDDYFEEKYKIKKPISYYTNKLEKYAKQIKCPEEIVNLGITFNFHSNTHWTYDHWSDISKFQLAKKQKSAKK